MASTWLMGFLAGVAAGFAARYGRLCTMKAVELALLGQDWRGLKAWALALAVAIAATQAGQGAGLIDLRASAFETGHLPVLALGTGGLLFGLGMACVGTCAFGVLVRAGGGDLRAFIAAGVIGIFGFAATSGLMGLVLGPLLAGDMFAPAARASIRVDQLVEPALGPSGRVLVIVVLIVAAAMPALTDRRLRRRPRLLMAAVIMGLAVGLAWVATSHAVSQMELLRTEALSFVAPLGRAIVAFMMEPLRAGGFAVATAAGVLTGALTVALWTGDFRWEAFDDPREMRRHLLGAALMGIGGAVAQGCSIGQGLTAGSALSLSMPMFWFCLLLGARLGLAILLRERV